MNKKNPWIGTKVVTLAEIATQGKQAVPARVVGEIISICSNAERCYEVVFGSIGLGTYLSEADLSDEERFVLIPGGTLVKQFMVIAGDPVTGFTYYGPYPSTADATLAAHHITHDEFDWWVAPLEQGGIQ